MSPPHSAVIFRIFCLVLNFCMLLIGLASAEPLTPKAQEVVSQAVFEVVVAKPVRDSLEYKDPLPLNEIPIAIRKDKYLPIGTAFAIGPRLMVSAAHVMSVGTETQFGTPLLRDQKGSLYEVDQILKLSERRDFVVFSIKNAPAVKPFEVNTSPHLNEAVFAVGNALGEGVVIRDGLYTSATPEQIDGEWNWLRFSAAASPGNSGGPLLDAKGRVIGVVLRKSPSENLNVALPIAEVLNARENVAQLFRTMSYMAPVAARFKGSSIGKFLPLPRSYQDLNRDVLEYGNRFGLDLQDQYFAEMQDRLFPNGPGSKPLLHSPPWSRFPQLFRMDNDGDWQPEKVTTKSVDLGNNGNIEFGEMSHCLVFALHRPENVTLDQLYHDDRLYMNLVLKGIRISRQVGQSPIRITSFGPASESYTFRDQYSRIWLVRSWLREFDDTKVITFSLPTPEGLITLMQLAQTGRADNEYLPDLKLMTNFINVAYAGNIKEWREFLQCRGLLPDGVAGISLSVDGHSFSFRTPAMSLTLDQETVPASEKNQIFLPMGFGISGNRASCDPVGVLVVQSPPGGTLVALERHLKPDHSLNENFQAEWQRFASGSFPYNRSSFSSDGVTKIMDVIGYKGGKGEKTYSVLVAMQGSADQKVMSKMLEKVVKGVTVTSSFTDSDEAGKSLEVVRLPYREYSPVMRSDRPSPVRYALQGQILAEGGDIGAAGKAFAKALELDPRCWEAYFQRGLMRQNHGESETARADYAKSMEYNPFYPDPYNNLGEMLYQTGKIDGAIPLFQKALDLDPKMNVARANLAKCFIHKGLHQLALQEYDKYIEQDPTNPVGYYNRGKGYRIAGNFGKALSDFDQAIKIKGTAVYYFARGYTFQQEKEYDKAISDYTAALQLDSRYASAYFNRATLYEAQGVYDKALADFSTTISLEPSTTPLVHRGNLLLKMKRYDEALADYTGAIAVEDKNVISPADKGDFFTEKGDKKKAISEFSRAIEPKSRNAGLYRQRGLAYLMADQFQQALDDLDRALSLDPRDWNAWYLRGVAHGKKGNLNESLSDLNKAISIEPQKADLYINRGFTLFQQKNLTGALADYQQAIILDPRSALAFQNRGNLYAAKKEEQAACSDWRRACELGACSNLTSAQKQGHCR